MAFGIRTGVIWNKYRNPIFFKTTAKVLKGIPQPLPKKPPKRRKRR